MRAVAHRHDQDDVVARRERRRSGETLFIFLSHFTLILHYILNEFDVRY